MKKIILFVAVVLLSSRAKAAVTFSIVSSSFTQDTSQGTFNDGQVEGALVSLDYTVSVKDNVTGVSCRVNGSIPLPGLLAYPPAGGMINSIQADVRANYKQNLQACINAGNNSLTQQKMPTPAKVSGVDGSAITP